jgi:hypothetical protein
MTVSKGRVREVQVLRIICFLQFNTATLRKELPVQFWESLEDLDFICVIMILIVHLTVNKTK